MLSDVCTNIGHVTVTPTGPELCAALAGFEPSEVGDDQLLSLLAAETRQSCYQQARQWAVMAELARRPPMLLAPGEPDWTPVQVFDSAVEEIRAELRLTRRAARRELEHADAVMAQPRIAQALASGAIDRR